MEIEKTRITEAFKDLRKLGYFARQNFECCQTCGWSRVPENKQNRAVFYHNQDNNSLRTEGKCHLAWEGDGNEIVGVLNKHGIRTEWDGTDNKRILMIL